MWKKKDEKWFKKKWFILKIKIYYGKGEYNREFKRNWVLLNQLLAIDCG
jgi:hypothetical protein